MIRRPPRSTRTNPLCPYTTLFRSKRLMATGFCWGGRIVWLYAAHNPKLRAGAAWYGHVRNTTSPLKPADPIALAGKLAAPVLGLYGEADAGLPVADRSEGRRGGKECVGTGSSWRSPHH